MTNRWGDAGEEIRARLECCLRGPLPEFADRTVEREYKWRASSALQKSIRRGRAATALAMAGSLMKMEPRYLVRRLPIIALEDVGLGNLDAVEETVWATQHAAWRRKAGGTVHVVLKLVERLATAVKDRSACDLVVAAGYDPDYGADREEMARLGEPELVKRAVDNDDPVIRCMAAWQLAGPGRFRTGDLREGTAPAGFESVLRAWKELGTLGRVRALARRAWDKGCDVLPLGLGVVAAMAEGSSTGVEPDDPLVKLGSVGGYPSECFDQHCQEGRRAIAYLVKAAPSFAKLLRAGGVPENRLRESVGELLFRVEGDAVDRRLAFEGSGEIRRAATGACLRWAGLRDGYHGPAMEMLRANLPVLQHARHRVLGLAPQGRCPREVIPEGIQEALDVVPLEELHPHASAGG